MNKINFKSQLLGFNRNEVNLYFEKLQTEYKLKEAELVQKVDAALNELEKEKKLYNDTAEKLKEVSDKLEYYKGKEDEIEKTSLSIATMYLVAKQNSEELLKNSKAAAEQALSVAVKQLEAAGAAEEKLTEVKEKLSLLVNSFNEEIAGLTTSLNTAKENLKLQLDAINPPKEIDVLTGEIEE